MPRPPIPDDQRRSALLRARVRPAAALAFREAAAKAGLTESAALREAVTMWMKRRAR